MFEHTFLLLQTPPRRVGKALQSHCVQLMSLFQVLWSSQDHTALADAFPLVWPFPFPAHAASPYIKFRFSFLWPLPLLRNSERLLSGAQHAPAALPPTASQLFLAFSHSGDRTPGKAFVLSLVSLAHGICLNV